jgi:hypothetical protein
MSFVFAMIPFFVSLIFLCRNVLILTGYYKEPILRTFEKYGDLETIYYPLPALLLWSGLLLFSLQLALNLPLALDWFGIVLILLSVGAYAKPQIATRFPQIFMSYPRWYFKLREDTSRYERRRIAYMWLWLPRRLRWAYNNNDQAFQQWTDLVILSTMRYDDSDSDWFLYR